MTKKKIPKKDAAKFKDPSLKLEKDEVSKREIAVRGVRGALATKSDARPKHKALVETVSNSEILAALFKLLSDQPVKQEHKLSILKKQKELILTSRNTASTLLNKLGIRPELIEQRHVLPGAPLKKKQKSTILKIHQQLNLKYSISNISDEALWNKHLSDCAQRMLREITLGLKFGDPYAGQQDGPELSAEKLAELTEATFKTLEAISNLRTDSYAALEDAVKAEKQSFAAIISTLVALHKASCSADTARLAEPGTNTRPTRSYDVSVVTEAAARAYREATGDSDGYTWDGYTDKFKNKGFLKFLKSVFKELNVTASAPTSIKRQRALKR